MSSNPEVLPALRQRVLTPLVVAGGVFVVLVAQHIVLGIVNLSGLLVFATVDSIGQLFQPQGFALDFVFAVGVFLALWLIMPIVAGLRLSSVVVRSVVATVAGAVLVFIAMLLIGFYNAIGGILSTQVGFRGEVASHWVGFGISTGGGYLVDAMPLVILVGILLWMWLAKHPSDTLASSLATEV